MIKKIKYNEPTLIAGAAILAIAFIFVMTSTQGKYWGPSEIDEYIIKITEGDEQSYLDFDTPTGMVSKGVTTTFQRTDCLERENCPAQAQDCEVVDNGYVMNNGRLVAKVAVVKCT